MALVRKSTDIVIEGFPRSANTWAVAAFREAVGAPIEIAHHVHAAHQIRNGVALGIPTLLLIREPVDAVVSLRIRYPHVSPFAALKNYVAFYRNTMSCKASCIVGEFRQVTNAFDQLMAEINSRFSVNYPVPEVTQNFRERVMRQIESMDRADSRSSTVSAFTVARPDANRTQVADIIKMQVIESRSDWVMRAEDIYKEVTSV